MACGLGSVRLAFDVTNPEAVRWARTRSARLVREITTETRQAIREMVGRAFTEGLPPRELAKLVRDAVGLTSRDADAVLNRFMRLQAEGRPAAQVYRMSRAYADRLHRRRALTIARTETMAASNEGQDRLWRQAMRAGHLDPTMRRMWITTALESCERCEPLDGTTAGMNESFASGVMRPPLHPNCRCTVGLVDGGRRR